MAGLPPPPFSKGLSLYDNLHDPNDPANSSSTISSAPVRYDQAEPGATTTTASKKHMSPAFQFQPVRRPPISKQKAKTSFPKVIPSAHPPAAVPLPAPPSGAPVGTETGTTALNDAPVKSTLADWAATEEDEWRYGTGQKHQRGGRKNKRRKQKEIPDTNWDDLYDPSRPTDVAEYLNSMEKIDEVREWRALLHRHKRQNIDSDSSSDDDDARLSMPSQFAPPASYQFAPPPPDSPPEEVPDDRTADDAYARRLAKTQGADTISHLPPPPEPAHTQLQPPVPPQSTTISAAPVRYTQSGQDEEPRSSSRSPPREESTEQGGFQPRTNRPGQTGFAQRLMSKYGWSSGEGLGASSTGIVTPLRVQAMKRKKRADADGGGWAEPANKGKIIGGSHGQSRTGQGEDEGFGKMSEVIILQHMLDGMEDLAAEIEDGLGQEIGEECGEKYGRVERLYIDEVNRQVFIKFTDQVSALRAVNELNGRIFGGNTIVPKFYDVEQFERGEYI